MWCKIEKIGEGRGGSEISKNDYGILKMITGGEGGGTKFDFCDYVIKVRPLIEVSTSRKCAARLGRELGSIYLVGENPGHDAFTEHH